MKWLNRIIYIALILASFLVIGVTSLFEVGFGEGALRDPIFYLTQIITDLAIILITVGTIYSVIDRFMETNDEYLKSDASIVDFAQDKTYVPSIMSKFLEYLNRKRKINQYKFNINKRLYNLTNYKPRIWYLLPWHWGKKRYTDEDLHVWNFGTPEEREKNDYCRKRRLIEEQLNEDIVNKNIDTTYVKYDRVTEEIILGGYYDKMSKRGPNEFVEQHLTSRIIGHKLPALLMSFGFTFLLSVLVVESLKFKSDAIISLLVKLISLAWNAFIAIRYGKQLCKSVILKDIRFRVGLITEYKKWLIQTADEQKPEVEESTDGTKQITGTIREDIEVHTDSVQTEQYTD